MDKGFPEPNSGGTDVGGLQLMIVARVQQPPLQLLEHFFEHEQRQLAESLLLVEAADHMQPYLQLKVLPLGPQQPLQLRQPEFVG